MDLITGINDHGRRLDRILRKALPDCPLPLIHKLLRKGLILVNGKPATPQTRVAKGSIIKIPKLTAKKITKKRLIPTQKQKPKNLMPQNINHKKSEKTQKNREDIKQEIPFEQSKPNTANPKLRVRFFHPPEVIWQDDGLIAFNKPSGLAVHGQVSLERMVSAYLVNKIPPSLSFKPGPLHRLDKPSSGIVVFSVSLEGANLFSTLMREHKIKKTYIAITEGIIKEKCFWTDYLIRNKDKKKSFVIDDSRGKIAVTKVMPLATAEINGKLYTLINAEIETGRTHQIRAQAAFHGHPLAGDRKYGGNFFLGGFYLHAWKMEFSGNKIEAPLPDEFRDLIDRYFSRF